MLSLLLRSSEPSVDSEVHRSKVGRMQLRSNLRKAYVGGKRIFKRELRFWEIRLMTEQRWQTIWGRGLENFAL